MFKFNLRDKYLEDTLYLQKDESIIPKKSGDWVLYFGGCWFALSIDKKTGRVLNYEGYSSYFYPKDNIEIPDSKKGAVYIEYILENDGAYYPEHFGFEANGYYDVNTGWYRVGVEYKTGEVIEIATNTLINLENGIILVLAQVH